MNAFVVITYLSVTFCFGVMFGAILEWKRLEAANEYRLPLTPMFILILLLIIAALGAVAVSK